MATITKREGKKGTTYRVEIRRKNYPKQIESFKRRTDAEKWARKIEREMDENKWKNTSSAENLLLSDALKRYQKEVSIKKRPGTQTRDSYSISYLDKKLGGYSVFNTSASLVSEYRDSRMKDASVHTVRIELSLLSHLFNIANKEWGFDIPNPVSMIKKPTIPEGRCPFLTTKQINTLLKVCKSSRTKLLYPFVVLALHTGCRSMESRGLRWDQIDLEEGYISLLSTETKTHQKRLVPLTETAKKTFQFLKKQAASFGQHGEPIGLVFPSINNPDNPRDMHMSFNRAVQKAKLDNLPDIGKLRIHDLRHICGTYLVKAGVDLETIRKILGHKYITTTQIYLHADLDHMKSSIKKLDTLGF